MLLFVISSSSLRAVEEGEGRRERSNKSVRNAEAILKRKSAAAHFSPFQCNTGIIGFRLHLSTNLQLRNATAGATQRMAGGENDGERENMWARGNADICQEIDNSNKLVAKHSNRLPNGTSVHSTPRLRTKHRIFPLPPPSSPARAGATACTRVRGSDGRARERYNARITCSPVPSELITVRRFAGRFYFSS